MDISKEILIFVTVLLYGKVLCQPAQVWIESAQEELKRLLSQKPNTNIAKNVILFLGDGMGMSTVTAARILKGQLQNNPGEETVFEFEKFPYVSLAKTYLIDRQTSDSAATATALLSGFKSKYYLVGLDGNGVYKDCSTVEKSKRDSIYIWSKKEGKSTGIVTTTRITHATPASAYAHTPHRDWEGDARMTNESVGCTDIAYQLIQDNDFIEVIFGGGRAFFLPNSTQDSETKKVHHWQRQDGLNLIEMWKLNKEEQNVRYKYVWNKKGFDSIDVNKDDFVLGLFNPSHMDYELERNKGPMGEPSLAEMTSKAIKILQKNDKGFFLMVEGGRIDHAHHDSLAKKALHETIAFEEAIKTAVDLTDERETLIVVTADHSHTFTMGGYPKRGNDILGVVNPIRAEDYPLDGKPFTTLMYSNGPGFSMSGERVNPHKEDTHDLNYVFHSGVPLESETHGGEDVAIYARGPMSHLLMGVREQHYVAHVMAYASCVGDNKDHCQQRSVNSVSVSSTSNRFMIFMIMIICLHL